MNNEEDTDTGTEVGGLTIESGEYEDAGLAEGDDDSEQLLRGLIEFTIGLQVEVNIDEVCASKELRIRSAQS